VYWVSSAFSSVWIAAKDAPGAAGNTMVPHYKASDVVRDNRVLPYGAATSEHRFTAPATCTLLEAEARLIYRPYPPALARERGWPSLDYLIASREVVVE
jgi:hypothetical protein